MDSGTRLKPGRSVALLRLKTETISLSGFYFQQQEQDPTNLYISNLPVSMDEQELEAMLKSFGQVISTRILRDSGGASRGVGFARWAARFLFSLPVVTPLSLRVI